MIPAHAPPHDTKELLKALMQAYTRSSLKERFESEVKHELQTDRYVTTRSGRRSLYLALKCSGIGPGDEVILPAFITDIVPMVIAASGAVPIPADVKIFDYNIDPSSVQECITGRTKAVLPVYTYGCPPDLRALRDICDDKKLVLIEDGAASFGATYNGMPIGKHGDFGILSFGVGKSISMGSGGGLTVRDEASFGKIIQTTGKNRASSLSTLVKISGAIALANPILYGLIGKKVKDTIVSHEYDHYKEEIQDNGDLSGLSYAIGVQELLVKVYEQRIAIARKFTGALKGIRGVYPQEEQAGARSVFSRYFVRVDSEQRRGSIRERLLRQGIEPLVPDYGYPITTGLYPIEMQDKMPNARLLSKTLIGLPISRRLPISMLESVFE